MLCLFVVLLVIVLVLYAYIYVCVLPVIYINSLSALMISLFYFSSYSIVLGYSGPSLLYSEEMVFGLLCILPSILEYCLYKEKNVSLEPKLKKSSRAGF